MKFLWGENEGAGGRKDSKRGGKGKTVVSRSRAGNTQNKREQGTDQTVGSHVEKGQALR